MIKIRGKEDFHEKLVRAIQETREALARARSGRKMPGEPRQNEALLQYLQDISRKVRSGKLPPRDSRRSRSLGWILVDGWDPADPLSVLIMEVDTYYIGRL